jgi:hypothetical protein
VEKSSQPCDAGQNARPDPLADQMRDLRSLRTCERRVSLAPSSEVSGTCPRSTCGSSPGALRLSITDLFADAGTKS